MRYRRHRMACSCPCVAHRGPRRPRGSNSSTATRPRSSATRTRGEATRARGDGQLNVSRAGHSETRIRMAGKSRSGGGQITLPLLLRGRGPLPAMPLPARRRCSCFAAGGPLKQERRGADHEPESAVEARCRAAASGDVSAVLVSALSAAATSFAKQKSGGA